MGNIDECVLESNHRARIDAEREAKLACVRHGGYILQSDHCICTAVAYDTLNYFLSGAWADAVVVLLMVR